MAVRLIFHSIQRGAKYRSYCFDDQLMGSRDRLNGIKISSWFHAIIYHKNKWKFDITAERNESELIKWFGLFLGSLYPCVDCRSLQRFAKSRMQILAKLGVKLMCNWKRRNDLIPNLTVSLKAMPSNEGEHASSNSTFAKQVASPLTQKRWRWADALPAGSGARSLAVAENYPDLKANTNFMQLRWNWLTQKTIFLCSSIVQQCHKQLQCEIGNFSQQIAGMFGFKQSWISSSAWRRKEYQRWTF